MNKEKRLAYSGLICALLAVSAFIKIPISPVPLTLQPFVVLLAPMVFGLRASLIGFVAYLILGLVGLPIFAHGGGIAYVLQPTFGYLVGFVLSAIPTGYFAKFKKFAFYLLGGAFGLVVIYGLGVSYLYINLNFIQHKAIGFNKVLYIGMLLPLPFDVIKLVIASVIATKLKNIINS
ncbi:biotin transporter BioY [Deferribacter autotrophicus]|uniref:Biotin transporter n=1 Tax=Deferribacter autotrophicus TaxID=500465 RepID=A0A5A8F5J0_9BACT|nr:biotin transporter BioY [Deferribacter autotrophicus]KAA0259396.1 biotin transporter BioY [Deferribacter autotrophicus]